MVRLVVKNPEVFEQATKFQFQYGAIGSETCFTACYDIISFNSSMVRLVAPIQEL